MAFDPMAFDPRGTEALQVLVVEHRDVVAARLKARLERLGHRVLGLARDGREAVSAVDRLHPDLVLVETRLPGIDGVDTARAIVSDLKVPVVLLTDYVGAELVRRARETGGIVAYLTSVDEPSLLEAIATVRERLAEIRVVLRQGSGDASEARATQKHVDQAKKLLIARLGVSRAEAFRLVLQRQLSTPRSLRETAWSIITADRLVARPDFADRLKLILQAVRRNLRWRRPVEDDAIVRC